MNFKRMMLVLVFFLVSGKFVFAQQEGVVQSSFTETGYFAAVEGIEGYQWMTDFESKSISYAVSLEIVKPFNKKVFAEIYFENPEDKSKPIIQEKVIGPLDKEMLVLSPPVLGLRRNAYYDLTILIYADTQKTELITKYADKIKAYMDGRYFGEIEEILGYALANDYDTAHDILKWRMKYSRTFIIESDLPPKKWTQRRDGFSIKTSSKSGGVQCKMNKGKSGDLTEILKFPQSRWLPRGVTRQPKLLVA